MTLNSQDVVTTRLFGYNDGTWIDLGDDASLQNDLSNDSANIGCFWNVFCGHALYYEVTNPFLKLPILHIKPKTTLGAIGAFATGGKPIVLILLLKVPLHPF